MYSSKPDNPRSEGVPEQPSDKQPADLVKGAFSSIGHCLKLPDNVVEVIRLVRDPSSTARNLHDLIKSDGPLSVRILKTVNSEFYGLPGQIASVDRAIILFGLEAVRNIAIASSLAPLFRVREVHENVSVKGLWNYSIAVAVLASKLAKISYQPVRAHELLLAGLIHDIGIIVEAYAFPGQLGEIIDEVSDGVNILEAEREIIGTDHQELGGALLNSWGLSREFRAVAGFHHNPETVANELRPIVSIVHLARSLASRQGTDFWFGIGQAEHSSAPCSDLMGWAGISPSDYDKTTAAVADIEFIKNAL